MRDQAHILITGGSGVLGWHLARYLARRGFRVTATFRRNEPELPGVRAIRFDLEQEEFPWFRLDDPPRAIIHTAAVSDPDACEKEPLRAQLINVEATRHLLAGRPPGAWFLFISTDLVFDGVRGNYQETDQPRPLNHYAATKLQAEDSVRRSPNAVVIRMAKLFAMGSPFHPCFVTWMLGRFEADQQVPLFEDQYRTPLYVGDAARGLEMLLLRPPRHNLYHLGGPERLSRLEFGRLFAQTYGLDPSLISAVSAASAGLTARGLDCSLNSDRFAAEYGFRAEPAAQALTRMHRGLD